MKEYTLTLQDEPLFWLGDRFYRVEEQLEAFNMTGARPTGHVTLESKCPSCNNTRKISYKGFDGKEYRTECPVCKGALGHGYGNCATLKNWEVHEYIVYRITDAAGPDSVSAYKDGKGFIQSIHLSAFHRVGRCRDQLVTTEIPWSSSYVDPDLTQLDINEHLDHNMRDYVFHEKKDAEKLLSMLKEFDRGRLEEFNETYGTDYEYPF